MVAPAGTAYRGAMAPFATHLVDRHLRLAPCPHCDGRGRGLVEAEGRLVGHCLRCGELLDAPLQVQLLGTALVAGASRVVAP